jgi:hypothetical protein
MVTASTGTASGRLAESGLSLSQQAQAMLGPGAVQGELCQSGRGSGCLGPNCRIVQLRDHPGLLNRRRERSSSDARREASALLRRSTLRSARKKLEPCGDHALTSVTITARRSQF